LKITLRKDFNQKTIKSFELIYTKYSKTGENYPIKIV